MAIIEELRTAIAESGLSQSELARQTGISQPTISRFLQADRGLRIEDAERLAEFFGLVLAKPLKAIETKRRG